ncbi:MAG: CoA transferase, partial [Myxococcota bacterium]
MRRPLAGIGILDLATQTPGKYCTFLLADLGASVLRVERPPSRPSPISDEDLVLNRGKRSLTLNLRSSEGRELLCDLAARSDVGIESSRPGVVRRRGVDPERLRSRNDRLIYCSLSGVGQEGPYGQRPAYDLIFMALYGALHALVGRHSAPFP